MNILRLGGGWALWTAPLVPRPFALQAAGFAPGTGTLHLVLPMPSSTPNGASFAVQAFTADASRPLGFAATNRLRFDVP